MTRLGNKGFGGIEILVLLIVVVIVSGAGWYMWKSKHKPVQKVEIPRCEAPAEAKGWLKYETENKAIKLCVPDGWKMVETRGLDVLSVGQNSELVYKPGTLAEVVKQDAPAQEFALNMSTISDAAFQNNVTGTKERLLAENGVTIDRYTFTQTKEPDLYNSTPQGATDYKYFISINNKRVRVDYRLLPGEQSNQKIVEKMVKSIDMGNSRSNY
jgi:hypothetical protein